jgi:hypothetical protein
MGDPRSMEHVENERLLTGPPPADRLLAHAGSRSDLAEGHRAEPAASQQLARRVDDQLTSARIV